MPLHHNATAVEAITRETGDAPAQRDRAPEVLFRGLVPAIRDGDPVALTCNRVRNTQKTEAENEGTLPDSPRERAVLELVTRLRLVPLGLVHESLFAGVSRQITGRFVRRMERRGWLRTWNEPREFGGRPTWLYSTAAGRKAGLEIVSDASRGTCTKQVVSAMMPSARTRPLELRPRLAPSFLRHQQETATLLVHLAKAHGAIWYSAWDRPLPQKAAPGPLPQPDGVLILPGSAGPELIFLEHDRGMESPAHFIQAKAERYAELAVRPELLMRLMGFATFRLAITVENYRLHRKPLERLILLARLLRNVGADREAFLTLAGWANAWPAGTVWCRADDPFVVRPRPAAGVQDPSLRHTLLCPAIRLGTVCACRARTEPAGSVTM